MYVCCASMHTHIHNTLVVVAVDVGFYIIIIWNDNTNTLFSINCCTRRAFVLVFTHTYICNFDANENLWTDIFHLQFWFLSQIKSDVFVFQFSANTISFVLLFQCWHHCTTIDILHPTHFIDLRVYAFQYAPIVSWCSKSLS